MAISASQVKELREITAAGMMDCKKALTECDGDIAKSIDWLREKGIASAAKKGSRIAAEGLSRVKIEGNTAVIFEVNSETDFVAKNEQFITLLNTIEATLIAAKPATVEAALALDINGETLETVIATATAKIGEKITLRRFEVLEAKDGEVFGCYMHNGGKISAVTTLQGGDAVIAKNISMQVASMGAQFVSRNEMPAEYIAHERGIQLEILKNDASLATKPEKVLQGIVEGRVSKTLQEVCLVDQVYFLDSAVKVGAFAKANSAEVLSFTRYIVGEGIEKREENFAEEVAAQLAGK